MKRYINQLTHAKSQCEKRLRLLGWMGYPVEEAVEASTMITRKVISELCKIAKNILGKYANSIPRFFSWCTYKEGPAT